MDWIKLIVIGVAVVVITGLGGTLINNKTKISNIETKLEIISKSNTKLQDGYEDLKIRQERLNIDEINALSQRLHNQPAVLEKTKNEQKKIGIIYQKKADKFQTGQEQVSRCRRFLSAVAVYRMPGLIKTATCPLTV